MASTHALKSLCGLHSERFVESFKFAVAERCRYEMLGEFLCTAQQWVNFYNTTQPHEGLDYRSPDQYAQELGRKGATVLDVGEHGRKFLLRRIGREGASTCGVDPAE